MLSNPDLTVAQREFRARWAALLRSGAFQQGPGYLAKDNKFCCFGVLCALAGGKVDTDRKDGGFFFPSSGEGSYATQPPAFVISQVGLMNAQTEFLMALNDSGVSFSEIADMIEEEDIILAIAEYMASHANP